MDSEDNNLERHSGDDDTFQDGGAYGSSTVVHAGISWRGGDHRGAIAPKIAPFTQPSHRRKTPAGISPIESVILGSSAVAEALREEVKLAAESNAPVLITGETGVGKELVAKEVHRLSDRGEAPFVPLNAAAICETLAGAELFGHTKGAFTGAVADRDGAFLAADNGVLFLDEIGDMPLSVQAQLLRVLDDGLVTKIGGRHGNKVDVRLVAATNIDLQRSVAAGKFRQDLFHRIEVFVIDVLPLRERGDDVIEIGEAILRTHEDERLRNALITPNAADRLREHRFPGNVRELRNVLTRAAIRARGGKIMPEHLRFADFSSAGADDKELLNIAKAKELIGHFVAMKALKLSGGNVSKAAKLTGRARGTMQELKRQLGGEHFASEFETAYSKLKALIGEC